MFRYAIKGVVAKVPRQSVAGRSFATYKTSTGLVGLAVDPNGRETLMNLASEVLQSVKKIPASSQYRKDVEGWFSFISKTTAEKADIKSIENEIDLGQIEEVIEMAKDELKLIDYYHDNRGWELVEAAQAEADQIVEEMADSIYFSSPHCRESYQSPEQQAAAKAAAEAAKN